MKQSILFFCVIIFFFNLAEAQQTHFSQFYSTSVYLNPTLAGMEEGSNLSLNYRNHWPQIQNSFITKNASFESNLPNMNGGFAINAYRDQAGDGMLSVSSYSGVYAYEIRLKNKLHLRAGLKAGFVQKNVAWDQLIFEDMIDSREGVVYNTQQQFGEAISYFDLASGLMIFNELFYTGLSINHINRAEAGLINQNGTSQLHRNYTLHGGAKFSFNKSNSISPNFLISKEGSFTKVNLGLYAEANALILGLWYANSNAMVFTAGINSKRFRIAYSYDLHSSTLIGSNLGSHELSFIQFFKKSKDKSRKYRTTPCPKF